MLAAQGVDVTRQAVLVFGIAEEEIDIVEKTRTGQETFVTGDAIQAGHGLVHPAVLARDVAIPHPDAGLGGDDLQACVDPESHAPGDLQGLGVAAEFIAVHQTRQDLV
jgi:hypothetical protein